MLIRSLLLAALALAAPAVQAQVCEGDIWLVTQAEVDAFECTEVRGTLVIGTYAYTNHDITDLNGLVELTQAESVRLLKNGALTDLDGLENLTAVGILHLEKNYGLRNVDGLVNLATIGALIIRENQWLLNLSGLANVLSIGTEYEEGYSGYTLLIEDNQRLATLSGLNGLQYVNGSVWIGNNNSLTNIDAFESVDALGGHLGIYFNDSLTDMDGLSNLTSIGNGLYISANSSLADVDDFYNLTTINEDLYLSGNDALTNIDGFATIQSISGNVNVRLNPVLTSCADGLAELIVEGGVGGFARFYQNAPGCNGVCEVTEDYNWCPTDADDEATPLVTGLAAPYPNPTTGVASITYTLAEPDEVTLTLYDALGRRVRTLAEGPQSAGEHEVTLGAGLPAGVYVVRFEAGEQAWTERVTLVR